MRDHTTPVAARALPSSKSDRMVAGSKSRLEASTLEGIVVMKTLMPTPFA
jgi:hypothetical protein